MSKIRRLGTLLVKRPFFSAVAISCAAGFAYTLVTIISMMVHMQSFTDALDMLLGGCTWAALISAFLALPAVLTLYNLFYLFAPNRWVHVRKGRYLEYVTVFHGAMCSLLWAWSGLTDIQWGQDWWVQLYNSELHTPIATWTLPTVIAIAAAGIAGYALLRCVPLKRMPPLVTVFAIGGMYLGNALCIGWMAQVIKHDILLCLYPFNLVLIALKVIKDVVFDWHSVAHPVPAKKSRLILSFYRLVEKSENWPWLGLICALPLLGLLIAVLTLFGQVPDSIIQAWIQTSDWTFSQQVAPQNIFYDTHYLCTVAAGGHRKIVKPLRVGKRHGNRVLVNRQLCVANAFEQLLQERLPRIHRAVRRFYDRYGYPIAKHIHSPYAADAIWFVMKPLEWFFVAVLYLFDTKPENRIAIQYPHTPAPEVEK